MHSIRNFLRFPPPWETHPSDKRSRDGFTLTELLVVVAIIVLLAGLVGPAFQAIKGGKDMTSMAIDIKGVLDQARTLAMAQNTYVYVGIQEVNAVAPTTNDGTGRVAMAILASQDGTRPWSVATNLTTRVSAVGKVRIFDNLHLTNSASLANGTTMLQRPGGSLANFSNVTVVNILDTNTAISFLWPLGTGGSHSFTKVIEFDPSGVSRLQTNNTPTNAIQSFIEISLLPARGNEVKDALNRNQVAIQIDGVTGRVTLYMPSL